MLELVKKSFIQKLLRTTAQQAAIRRTAANESIVKDLIAQQEVSANDGSVTQRVNSIPESVIDELQ